MTATASIPVRPACAASWCPTCREFTVLDVGRKCAWCDTHTTEPPALPARKRTGVVSRLSDEHVRALHRAHTSGHSLRALGRFLVAQGIYPTENAGVEGVRAGFRRLGLQARDRVEATVQASTKHGLATRHGRGPEWNQLRASRRRETGEVRGVTCGATLIRPPHTGKRCSNAALADSTYCRCHDPRYATEVASHLADARARIGASA